MSCRLRSFSSKSHRQCVNCRLLILFIEISNLGNVLLDTNSPDAILKLADFGMARYSNKNHDDD